MKAITPGRLTVELTVATPLLVPDASKARKSGEHTILPLLTDRDRQSEAPADPRSRGALRAAYEAITNSRFGVFEKHDTPLGRRMDARRGPRDGAGGVLRKTERLNSGWGRWNPINHQDYRSKASARPTAVPLVA